MLSQPEFPDPLPDEARKTLQWPIRKGGFGLASVAMTSPAAYQALPSISACVPLPSVAGLSGFAPIPPMFRHLFACHKTLASLGCPTGENGILPTRPEMFCEWYAEGAEPRLQHAITASLDDHVFHARLQHFATPLHDRIRIMTFVQAAHSSEQRLPHSCTPQGWPSSSAKTPIVL